MVGVWVYKDKRGKGGLHDDYDDYMKVYMMTFSKCPRLYLRNRLP